MSVENQVKGLREARQKAWEAAKELLDHASRSGRDLTGEERQAYDRADAEITRLDKKVNEILASDEARNEVAEINEEYRRAASGNFIDESRTREKDAMARAPALLAALAGNVLRVHAAR